MVCLDASLLLAILLPENLSERSESVLLNLLSAGEEFVAPALLVSEVSSGLRKAVHRKRVPTEAGDEALETFKLMPIRLYELTDLIDPAWGWAKTLNAPRLYDMYYLALAEREGCDLWTADGRMARLVGNRSQHVCYVGDLQDEA